VFSFEGADPQESFQGKREYEVLEENF
jgi:hypothetical protein